MNELDDDPVAQAGTKIGQYMSFVMIASEAIAQIRQQRAAAAAMDARAARAKQASAHAAARLRWQPILDPRRQANLNLTDTGLAWFAAQPWRATEPEAQVATDRAQDRLRELRPDVMARFDQLTADGLEPLEAMHRVSPYFDLPAVRPSEPHSRSTQSDVTPAHLDRPESLFPAVVSSQSVPDLSASVPAPESLFTARARTTHIGVEPAGSEQTVPATPPPDLTVGLAAPALSMTGGRTPPQIARDGFPEPLTGEVLAAGRVKPKAPDRTAAAAVRSTSLATAARASSSTPR